jgi:outer membrane receptor for ferrienterochelin and colicin
VGLGKFLTRDALAKQEGRLLSDVVRSIPGTQLSMGRGSRAWLVSGRGIQSGSANKLDVQDSVSGARSGLCYAQVYVDHTLMYGARKDGSEPLFDLNSVPVTSIEAIEYYRGPSETPLEYSNLNSVCGVLVIWMRHTP